MSTTAPRQPVECWAILYKMHGLQRTAYCGHNSVVDYRYIDPEAVAVHLTERKACDACKGHEETLTRLQSELLRERLAKEAGWHEVFELGRPVMQWISRLRSRLKAACTSVEIETLVTGAAWQLP